MKPKLLYLAHRIPYPPNKGDKIRSFHWLKGLSEYYDIYLGTFIDDINDWQYVEEVKKYCADVFVVNLNPTTAKIKSLTGLLTGQALSLPYYNNNELQQWVKSIVEQHEIKNVLVFSSAMAQFVEDKDFQDTRRIMDFVDIDSDKWQQYAESKSGIMKWVYSREARKLFAYEKCINELFDASLFVSSTEAETFRELMPVSKEKVDYVNNGVDIETFNPELELENPYDTNHKILVFTGAMDYWANVDAVVWFVNTHFQKIKVLNKNVQLYIVGSNPSKEVLELQKVDGVAVTGKVPSMLPYIRYADLAIAPMRIARGIQNKVLEAMAMEKVTLVSPQAYEGIQAESGEALILVQNENEWVDTVDKYLTKKRPEIGKAARSYVADSYSWSANIQKLKSIIEEP